MAIKLKPLKAQEQVILKNKIEISLQIKTNKIHKFYYFIKL